MATTFATELRRNFDQASEQLTEEALAVVARARDTRMTGLTERDQLLAEIVVAYRTGPHDLWAPVILDLLAPALVRMVRRIEQKSEEIADLWNPDEPLAVDEDELRQQLLMEVLRAAATIPLRPGGRGMKTRLLKRVNTYLIRWVKREFRPQIWHRSLEAIVELGDECALGGAGTPSRRTREMTSPDDGN
jgi:hypothetical protein